MQCGYEYIISEGVFECRVGFGPGDNFGDIEYVYGITRTPDYYPFTR
jgi:hypothetical protein